MQSASCSSEQLDRPSLLLTLSHGCYLHRQHERALQMIELFIGLVYAR